MRALSHHACFYMINMSLAGLHTTPAMSHGLPSKI
jgi:hypothetical protein